MASHALLTLLCLLLAVGTATAAAAAAGGVPHRRLLQQRARPGDEPTGDDDEATNVPSSSAAAVAGCWKSILASESCLKDMVESLASLDVRVSKVCCSVLEKIGDECVPDVVSSFPLNLFHLHPSLLMHGCSLAV